MSKISDLDLIRSNGRILFFEPIINDETCGIYVEVSYDDDIPVHEVIDWEGCGPEDAKAWVRRNGTVISKAAREAAAERSNDLGL